MGTMGYTTSPSHGSVETLLQVPILPGTQPHSNLRHSSVSACLNAWVVLFSPYACNAHVVVLPSPASITSPAIYFSFLLSEATSQHWDVVRAFPSIVAWLLPNPTVEGLLAVVALSATAGTVVTVTRGSQVITSLLLGASDKIVKPFQNRSHTSANTTTCWQSNSKWQVHWFWGPSARGPVGVLQQSPTRRQWEYSKAQKEAPQTLQ